MKMEEEVEAGRGWRGLRKGKKQKERKGAERSGGNLESRYEQEERKKA